MITENAAPAKKSLPWAKILIAIVVIAALVLAGRYFNIPDKLQLALDWVEGLGPAGPAVFILIYILACVFFISGAALTLGAGGVFGLLMGCIYVSIGSTLGATAAFLVGRYLARDKIAKKIKGNPTFAAIDEAVANEGWKIVGLTRLSPVFPFVLLNYAFGLTKVPLGQYMLASWIGMMPGTVMFVYFGYIAAEVATGGDSSSGPLKWVINIVGLAATVGVTVFVTRIAKRALDSRIETEDAAAN